MNENFWPRALRKLVENLLSVKVWVIFSFLVVTTVLVWHGKITGDIFGTVNGGVIVAIVGLREAFKVSKVKSGDDTKNMMV